MDIIRRQSICVSLVLVILAAALPCSADGFQNEQSGTEKLYSEIKGDYVFSLDEGTSVITFFLRDGSLFGCDQDDGEEVELKPVNLEELEFEAISGENVHFFLQFLRDDRGEVTRVILSANELEMEGEKIK